MPDGDASAEAVEAVRAALGHAIGDARLLGQALTHASRCGAQASQARKRREANERLEFLGDAMLGAALAQGLYERHPDSDEGHLSLLRSSLASRAALARAIDATGLLAHARVGAQVGDDIARWPDSVKANLAESVLAAIWLDGGWAPLRAAVERLLSSVLDDPETGRQDARMRLQEWSLERDRRLPSYVCARCGGSDHEPEFEATVTVGERSATGRGTSRRRAEAAAADALLAIVDPAPASTPPDGTA